jgi:hypothetical protein
VKPPSCVLVHTGTSTSESVGLMSQDDTNTSQVFASFESPRNNITFNVMTFVSQLCAHGVRYVLSLSFLNVRENPPLSTCGYE